MAVDLDNMDSVIANMVKLEKAVENEVIRDVRKRFKAVVRKYIPRFKGATPEQTGALIKSIKMKSRSKRGVTKIRMTYTVPYAPFVNLQFSNSKSRLFANNKYKQEKQAIEAQGIKAIRLAFKETFEKHGIKVK